MKILFHILHPAHVHFFKNTIDILKKNGHQTEIIAREKDVALELLNNFGLEYDIIGKQYSGTGGMIKETFSTIINVGKYINEFDPDLIVSIGGFLNVVPAWFLRRKAIYFTDHEPTITNIISNLFTKYVITPSCFRKDFGKKHLKYNGYHELAYLHPNRFKPNPNVLEELGLSENEPYFILRFISWQANHDIGHKGLSSDNKKKLVDFLSGYGKVVISSEKKLEPYFEPFKMSVEPSKMLDLLYYSTLYIGEGITIASEASVVGVPSILINSMITGYVEEQENKYGLLFRITDFDLVLKKTKELLSNPNLKDEWKKKREIMLKDKIDVTQFIVDFIENLLKDGKIK